MQSNFTLTRVGAEHAADTAADQRLGPLIGLASRQWRRLVDLRLQAYDLTEATWMPLLRLARADKPMRQKDLAAALFLDSSSVVRLLSTLAGAGLVERGEDETDGRAKAITITRRGRALVRRVERLSAEVEQEVLAGLSADDVAAARRVLDHVSASLVALTIREGKA